MEGKSPRDFWLKVLLLGLFVFALYSNVQLIIRNHALGKVLADKKAETVKETFDNQKLKLLIAYYQTPSYQEVEARRRLQLKKPDETAYLIKGLPTASDSSQPSTLSDSLYKDIPPAVPVPKTNIQLWWEYFFK